MATSSRGKRRNRVSDDPYQSCRYARGFILGKVYNARWALGARHA